MRLFTKIFLAGVLVLGLAFSASGYFLLHYSLESSLAREADFALKQYQYDKFTVQSAMLTDTAIWISLGLDDELAEDETFTYTIREKPKPQKKSMEGMSAEEDKEEQSGTEGIWARAYQSMDLFAALALELSVPAAFYAEDHTLLYSNIQDLDPAFLDNLTENAHIWQYCKNGAGGSILVGSIVWQEGVAAVRDEADAGDTSSGGCPVYFVTQWDISKTLQQQDTLRQYFLRCYLIVMAAGMALLILLSAFLTGPLNRMSRAARRIAAGDYGERLPAGGRDEIGGLADSFNQMAGAVEGKIDELARAAREKEDFVANFAHELKTPLTSIIGYADTIYQKELSREETRKAFWHIWNEGMRLESLSYKLMELTVLGRQEFPLTELPADELLQDVGEGLAPLFRERQIDFLIRAEQAYVLADYDLLKTLLINLTDNSVKAGADRIELTGQVNGGNYLICVRDNGCGMEQEELSRITEAFYMVDKARSRKQHGAGLGLALAEQAARLHGDRLAFESRAGAGTAVSFSLRMAAEPPSNKEEKGRSSGTSLREDNR